MKLLVPLVILLFSATIGLGQTTLLLQPGPADGMDASLGYHDNFGTENNNYGTDLYLKAFAIPGAEGGVNSNRGLLWFDLSQIPAGATIVDAELSLFATGYINDLLPGHFGNNAAWLRRVTSSWQELTVTWNTQPSVTNQNEVLVPMSSGPTQDYALNVTDLVTDMMADPTNSFGFCLQLEQEDPGDAAALAFYSSDWSGAGGRPMLAITYEDGPACGQAGPAIDCDASLGYHDNFGTENNNYGTDLYLKAFAIPGAQGGVNSNRGLLRFDLSLLSPGQSVLSAELRLFGAGYINSNLPGHFGNNSAVLERITSSWDEGTVTWVTAPSSTTVDQVALPQSSSADEDYVLDVRDLVQDMVDDPANSHGFLLRLPVEDPGDAAALAFHSSDGPEQDLWPELCVTWHGPIGISEQAFHSGSMVRWADGHLKLILPEVGPSAKVELFDASGRRLFVTERSSKGIIDLIVPDLNAGIHICRCTVGNYSRTEKFVVQR